MNTTEQHKDEIVAYYENTGLDYREWSKEFNMHFGYYRFPMNPCKREPMLEEMNRQVFNMLQLNDEDNMIYDLGAGVAAPSRSFAKKYPRRQIKAITIVKWQIDMANALNSKAGLANNIEMVHADYTKLPFAENSADAAYALESCCHSEGLDKAAFIKEMMRVLKPGKRFVIADGFVKKDPETFGPLTAYCYKQITTGWALPSFPHLDYLKNALQKEGAADITIRDISMRIAPSVAHAPFAVFYFLIKKFLQGEKLNPLRIGHLKACLLGIVLGLHRGKFAYCLISGIKEK